ncbi:MAG: succinylglutamate desuccinylase/aspartoacylase family protein [Terriglobales bacterium]
MFRLIAILTLTLAASAQQLTVGTATASPGQRADGYLEVPTGVDAGTRIPVVVIRGAKPGPTLAIVSGLHGTEYASIIAVEKLIQKLDPAAISGSVILVPLVNVGSFEEKVPHVNPVDKKSMNRYYPGNPTGTQTDRVSYMMTKEVVDKADNLIDLHGGDLDESLRPYSYWAPTGNASQDETSKEMNLAFGLDTIIIWRERPSDPKDSRYLDNTAAVRGKPSLAAEAGYAGTVETDDVNRLVNGCLGVMRYLKMLAGEVHPISNPVWIERIETASSTADGIFYPLVKRGTYVQQGMKIGYVTDWFGKTVQEATAPASGVVLYICAVPSMKKGGTIANIGVVGKAP